MTQAFDCECGDHSWFRLSRGLVGLVSPQDRPLVEEYRWNSHRSGALASYIYRPVQTEAGPRKVYLHRAIIDPPKPLQVDHANWNGLDDRRSNLRAATKSQNQANARRRAGSSGAVGVQYRGDQARQWAARFSADGVQHYLGSFNSREEAAAAVIAARRSTFGAFAGPPL